MSDVLTALMKSADEMLEVLEYREGFRRQARLGIAHSKDSYYGQHAPETMPNHVELQTRWDQWVRGGAICSEMESSTLFTLAAIRKVRAGGIMIVGDPPHMNSHAPERVNVSVLAEYAIDGLRNLIMKDMNS